AVECMPSSTGSRADHRLALRPSEIEGFARAVAAAIGSGGANGSARDAKWIAAIAKDLTAHRGRSLVVAGDHQPAAVHAVAHAMNEALGNVGTTVMYTEPVETNPVNQFDSLRELIADMNGGKVDLLLILGGNPVYTAPIDL